MARQSLEKRGEEYSHDAFDHALTEGRELAADIGAIAIMKGRLRSRQGREGHQRLAFAEAERALSAAGQFQAVRRVELGQTDRGFVDAADARNADADAGAIIGLGNLFDGFATRNDL